MWCYSNTCANDGLIRLDKFVSQITDRFCNLFFISIGTPHVTPLYDTQYDTPKLYALDLNKTAQHHRTACVITRSSLKDFN
jgi:hypothetical protein